MKLNLESLKDREGWEKLGVQLPAYDVRAMRAETAKNPVWVHFGAGNIFRAFIAVLQQRLLDSGEAKAGIIAADTFDVDNIRQIYGGFENLTMSVTLNPDGSTSREVVGSVAEALVAQPTAGKDWERLRQVFAAPGLQLVSFTITEKGYALKSLDGSYSPVAQADFANGPEQARHAVSIVTALMWARYQAGARPQIGRAHV